MTSLHRNVPPYTRLAKIYDDVMAHVDYEEWAEYAGSLIQRHMSDVERVLELGCGTGTLAFKLQPRLDAEYMATDLSAQMIEVAKNKPEASVADISFAVRDFREIHDIDPVDVVMLLYDGLNYLLDEDEIRELLSVMHEVLRPGGIAIFDQSTLANSMDHKEEFNDAGERYRRKSWYDEESEIHTTVLEVISDDTIDIEMHQQRAYDPEVIRELIEESPFTLLEALDDFTLQPASSSSHRVHWVVRKSA